ncbi:hypothetical protein LTR50_000963 [Elasticomyces elasticus]|nr:hypothetical protein LTR50_000963 [Elasticomyces elasticus]
MYHLDRNDPRLRRTLNELSHTLESANESAQANIFTFSQHYLSPCFSSLGTCLQSCAGACLPSRDERKRRRGRGRSRGRAEQSFDFYDDWDEDEGDGLLGWGNDEFDRLIAGSGQYGSVGDQPGRQRAMSYGARRETGLPSGRRKGAAQPHDGGPDPTGVPATSRFGFLGKLSPWGGRKELRYRPSAADLQEHPGAGRRRIVPEDEPLIEESGESGVVGGKKHGRNRSGTVGSAGTLDSLSSRGDLFPSEDEDDAVPLDDEFAMVLERRTTQSGQGENGSGKTRLGKRRSADSRMSTRTVSSRSARSSRKENRAGSNQRAPAEITQEDGAIVPSLTELKQEEERIRHEEEAEIERKREAAQDLARRRGLSNADQLSSTAAEGRTATPTPPSPLSPQEELKSPTSPFPVMQVAVSIPEPQTEQQDEVQPVQRYPTVSPSADDRNDPDESPSTSFVPAQLPHFGRSQE